MPQLFSGNRILVRLSRVFVYELRVICCRETGMHHLRLLHRLGQLAALMFFPCWLLVGLFPPTPSHKKK
jgi:hypothetical protein